MACSLSARPALWAAPPQPPIGAAPLAADALLHHLLSCPSLFLFPGKKDELVDRLVEHYASKGAGWWAKRLCECKEAAVLASSQPLPQQTSKHPLHVLLPSPADDEVRLVCRPMPSFPATLVPAGTTKYTPLHCRNFQLSTPSLPSLRMRCLVATTTSLPRRLRAQQQKPRLQLQSLQLLPQVPLPSLRRQQRRRQGRPPSQLLPSQSCPRPLVLLSSLSSRTLTPPPPLPAPHFMISAASADADGESEEQVRWA